MSRIHTPTSWTDATTAREVAQKLRDEIKGKNVIITGVTIGNIGFEAACAIASATPGLLILAGRSQSKLDEAIKKIKEEFPDSNLETLIIDVSNLTSVKQAFEEISKNYEQNFHVIINNAAYIPGKFERSVDGIELQFAAAHLGHFLFTNLLLKSSKLSPFSPSAPCRVINISSAAHRLYDVNWEDINFSNGKEYGIWKGYGQAKSANCLHAVELARRFKDKGLVAFSLHPGRVAGTQLAVNMTNEHFGQVGLVKENMNTSDQRVKTTGEGAASYLVCAFDPGFISLSGSYVYECRPLSPGTGPNGTPTARVFDEERAKKLWKMSEEMVGERFDF